MRYIPHTEQDIGSMLAVLGLGSVDELFSHLPDSLRAQAHIALPPGVSEAELRDRLTELATRIEARPRFSGRRRLPPRRSGRC